MHRYSRAHRHHSLRRAAVSTTPSRAAAGKCVAQRGKVARRRRNLGAAGENWAKMRPRAAKYSGIPPCQPPISAPPEKESPSSFPIFRNPTTMDRKWQNLPWHILECCALRAPQAEELGERSIPKPRLWWSCPHTNHLVVLRAQWSAAPPLIAQKAVAAEPSIRHRHWRLRAPSAHLGGWRWAPPTGARCPQPALPLLHRAGLPCCISPGPRARLRRSSCAPATAAPRLCCPRRQLQVSPGRGAPRGRSLPGQPLWRLMCEVRADRPTP